MRQPDPVVPPPDPRCPDSPQPPAPIPGDGDDDKG